MRSRRKRKNGSSIYLENSTALISSNKIRYNYYNDNNSGGGGIYSYSSSAIIENNIIHDNEASANGGGIHTGYTPGTLQIINNLIYNNKALGITSSGAGGGICSDSDIIMINNTIFSNTANLCGGGVYAFRGNVTIINTIMWGNQANKGPQLSVGNPNLGGDNAIASIDYSDVEGGKSLVYVDDPQCMNDLAKALGVSHSRITRIVDNLVYKKFVRRFPSPTDRRSWIVELTPEGAKANDESVDDFLGIQMDILKEIPANKIQTVLESVTLYINSYQKALNKRQEEQINGDK